MKRAVETEGFDLDTLWKSSSTYSFLRCTAQPDSTRM